MWNPDPPVPIMVLFPATLTENDRNCLLPNYKNLHLRFFFSFTIGLRTERIASSKTCEKVASRDKRLLYIARLLLFMLKICQSGYISPIIFFDLSPFGISSTNGRMGKKGYDESSFGG